MKPEAELQADRVTKGLPSRRLPASVATVLAGIKAIKWGCGAEAMGPRGDVGVRPPWRAEQMPPQWQPRLPSGRSRLFLGSQVPASCL